MEGPSPTRVPVVVLEDETADPRKFEGEASFSRGWLKRGLLGTLLVLASLASLTFAVLVRWRWGIGRHAGPLTSALLCGLPAIVTALLLFFDRKRPEEERSLPVAAAVATALVVLFAFYLLSRSPFYRYR